MQLNIANLIKFGDGNGPNLCRVKKKVDIRSTFIEKIFRSGLTVVSLNDIMIWPTCCNSNHCIVFKTWKINLNIYFMKLIWIVFNSCTLHVFVYLLQQCHKVIIVLYEGLGAETPWALWFREMTSWASFFAEWPPNQSKSSQCLMLPFPATATLSPHPAWRSSVSNIWLLHS